MRKGVRLAKKLQRSKKFLFLLALCQGAWALDGREEWMSGMDVHR
jgi:hypothetical protein